MSLLLESLKKAALEKQKKEKSTVSVDLLADPANKGPEDYKHENKNLENENLEKIETKAEEIEFNSDEFEFVVEPQVIVEESAPPEKEQLEIKSADVIDDFLAAEKIQASEEKHLAKPEKHNTAEIKNTPEKEYKVPSFTPESGKAALALLLEKNKKIEKSGKIRSRYVMGLLLITGLGTLGGYYYFLMDDSSSIAPTNQMRLYTHENNPPVTNAIPVTENTFSETASEVVDDNSANTQDVISSESIASNNDNLIPVDEPQVLSQPVSLTESVSDNQIKNRAFEKSVQKTQPEEFNNTHARVNSQPIESYIQSHPQVEDTIAQQVSVAYRSYQQGRWSEAQTLYQNVLMQDPYNRDALLGAAAVAVRQGRSQEALGYYQQQLERDPQDEYAISGIMTLSLDANNLGLLSEIDRRLQEKPASVHLLLLKGSLLAGQRQWSVAQEVFFEAWRYDKNNADIAYNLAICLDRLNQSREAIRFYEMALSLKTPGANFSSAAVEKRLASLARSTP
jgi:tetratricopeptide (TPR) repeat protein